jgi:glucose-1-phosphate adenylyltransferase
MGIYVFSRDVLLDVLDSDAPRLRPRDHPGALGSYTVNAYLFRGYWADVGTVESFYDANIMLTRPARRSSSTIRAGRSTRTRASCPARASATARCATRSSRGLLLDRATIESRRRHPDQHPAAHVIRRSVLLGADFYEVTTRRRR